MLQTFTLEFETTPFFKLSNTPLAQIVDDRRVGIFTNPIYLSGDRTIYPLVRGTNSVSQPMMEFTPLIHSISKQIREKSGLVPRFNNVMIETFGERRRTMKYHTDQMLDLEDHSFIAIFSCYTPLKKPNPRTLIIKKKGMSYDASRAAKDEMRLTLHNHSVVLFSTEFNRKHTHKICLEKHGQTTDGVWLSLTFRLAKHGLEFEKIPQIIPLKGGESTPLVLATEEERFEMFKLKTRENKEEDFVYPIIGYTLSPGDLLPLKSF